MVAFRKSPLELLIACLLVLFGLASGAEAQAEGRPVPGAAVAPEPVAGHEGRRAAGEACKDATSDPEGLGDQQCVEGDSRSEASEGEGEAIPAPAPEAEREAEGLVNRPEGGESDKGEKPSDGARQEPGPPEQEPDQKEEGTWPRFEFGARLMTGWELQAERPSAAQGGSDQNDNGFFLDQARVALEGRMHKRVVFKASADLADAVRPDTAASGFSAPPYLRNAFLNLRFCREFQLRAGRFKRPFSGLENRSTGRLPFRGRGLTNGLIVEDAGWGDRALGLMLWGKARSAGLSWYASLSNPDWEADGDLEDDGVDVLGRLLYAPVDWLSVGVSGGHKLIKRSASGDTVNVNAVSGDLSVSRSGLYLAAEVLGGQLPEEQGSPFAFGIVGYASYDVALTGSLLLQPCIFGEYADANADFAQTEAFRAIVGVNLLWYRNLRLMPQVELVRPLGEVSALNPWKAGETFYLLLSAQL